MKQQSMGMIIVIYFGFGTLIGIFLALLALAISNNYITHHDLPDSQTTHRHTHNTK
jgi:hypothetical protein